jgi:catechol 2,3-dioxygenase-like lactoylglutathione lyase family enzyme
MGLVEKSIMTTVAAAEPSPGKCSQSDSLVVPTQIAHIVLYSLRFDEMVPWYKTVFHMRPSHEDENLSFLTYDSEHHRIAIVRMPHYKPQQEGVAGFNHIAFTYKTLLSLLLTHERLAALGIRPYWTVNHGPTTSMYFRDPDGNRVEMQVDNFDTAAEGIAYCRLPEFAENPIGVDFDAPEMLQRLRAGASEASLKIRPRIGPRGMGSFPLG